MSAQFAGEFVAQNIRATEEAMFEGVPVFDEDSGHIFPPYTMKTVNGRRIAIIGQAFPYTPIANPSRFIPNWTFGIQEQALMALGGEACGRSSSQARSFFCRTTVWTWI